ncbi:hypothetical protein GQ457_12G032550 [Hibiscus cannabinus]
MVRGGKHDIEKEAEKLEPCTYAAQHRRAPVSEQCCTVMEKKVKNPACLCAVLYSQTAYNAGVRPEIAVSIPKRCNIVDRPVGYKCGGLNGVVGTAYYYGPCGKHDIEKEAEKLEPCTYAAQHRRAPVSEKCCTLSLCFNSPLHGFEYQHYKNAGDPAFLSRIKYADVSLNCLNGVVGNRPTFGPCGRHDVEKEAEKLEPCSAASQQLTAPVSAECCTVMTKKMHNPPCFCAILFTQTARDIGLVPEIAVSLPQRCNVVDRPANYKSVIKSASSRQPRQSTPFDTPPPSSKPAGVLKTRPSTPPNAASRRRSLWTFLVRPKTPNRCKELHEENNMVPHHQCTPPDSDQCRCEPPLSLVPLVR